MVGSTMDFNLTGREIWPPSYKPTENKMASNANPGVVVDGNIVVEPKNDEGGSFVNDLPERIRVLTVPMNDCQLITTDSLRSDGDEMRTIMMVGDAYIVIPGNAFVEINLQEWSYDIYVDKKYRA